MMLESSGGLLVMHKALQLVLPGIRFVWVEHMLSSN